MAEILTVLTYKSAAHLIEEGGTQSWVIGPQRAIRCRYVVCVRHQQGPFPAEGDEPHKSAFLVGKVSGVSPSTDTAGRWKVDFLEYALVKGPLIPLVSASPTQYFPSLESIGIDETTLEWRPTAQASDNEAALSPSGAEETADGNEGDGDEETDELIDTLVQAKQLVADHFHIALNHVEIVIRI